MARKKVTRALPQFEIIFDGNAKVKGELYPALAPSTVGHFIHLANSGYYDGAVIHHLVPGSAVQIDHTEKKLPYCIPGECELNGFHQNVGRVGAGSLCLCHGPHYDSGKADFLIALSDSSRLVRTLEGAFALFGQVLEGLGFIQSLSRTPCSEEGVPQIYHKILSIRVETFGDEYDFTTCEEPPPLPWRPICESESDPLEQTQA